MPLKCVRPPSFAMSTPSLSPSLPVEEVPLIDVTGHVGHAGHVVTVDKDSFSDEGETEESGCSFDDVINDVIITIPTQGENNNNAAQSKRPLLQRSVTLNEETAPPPPLFASPPARPRLNRQLTVASENRELNVSALKMSHLMVPGVPPRSLASYIPPPSHIPPHIPPFQPPDEEPNNNSAAPELTSGAPELPCLPPIPMPATMTSAIMTTAMSTAMIPMVTVTVNPHESNEKTYLADESPPDDSGDSLRRCSIGSAESLVSDGLRMAGDLGIRRVSEISHINELRREVSGLEHINSEFYEISREPNPDAISLDSIHKRVLKRCQNKYIPPQKSTRSNKVFVIVTTGFTILGIVYGFWYKNFGPGKVHEGEE